MYKLLIVDDEPYAVEIVSELFRTAQNLDFDIYKAYSGKEAIELLSGIRMDIVFTDIRMPGMDGLQLIGEILALWPITQIIVLTGYNDFETIYAAQNYDNVSFLVKTENYDVIIAAAEKAINRLEANMKYETMEQKLHEQNIENVIQKQSEYLLALLVGRLQMPATNELFDKLSVDLDANQPVLVVLGYPAATDTHVHPDRYYAGMITQIVEQSIGIRFRSAHIMPNENIHVWLIQPRHPESGWSQDTKQIETFLNGDLELSQNCCYDRLSITLSFLVSDEAVFLRDTGTLTSRMITISKSAFTESMRILRPLDLKSIGEEIAPQSIQFSSDMKKKLEQLESYMINRNRELFSYELGCFFKAIQNNKRLLHNHAYELYYSMLLTIIQRVNAKEQAKVLPLLDELLDLKPLSWNEAECLIYEITGELFLQPKASRQEQLVFEIECYIQQNIGCGLTTAEVSRYFHFNPSYLSRIYKQMRGSNLSDYITFERIRQAKRLLKDPRLHVGDIASRLGYGSPAYFCYLFKKITGTTPQEFRAALV